MNCVKVGTWSDHSLDPPREKNRNPPGCFLRHTYWLNSSSSWPGLPHGPLFFLQDREKKTKSTSMHTYVLGIFPGRRVLPGEKTKFGLEFDQWQLPNLLRDAGLVLQIESNGKSNFLLIVLKTDAKKTKSHPENIRLFRASIIIINGAKTFPSNSNFWVAFFLENSWTATSIDFDKKKILIILSKRIDWILQDFWSFLGYVIF